VRLVWRGEGPNDERERACYVPSRPRAPRERDALVGLLSPQNAPLTQSIYFPPLQDWSCGVCPRCRVSV
jgi:hypothetical protein